MPSISHLSFPRCVAALLCLLLCTAAVADTTSSIRQARELILVGQNASAAQLLLQIISTSPENPDKDIARLLYQSIAVAASPGRGKTQAVASLGTVTSDSSAVRAEKLRLEIANLLVKGARADALRKSLALLKQYPDEFSDIDLFYAFSAADPRVRNPRQFSDLMAIGNARFPGSPIFLWGSVLPLHWSNDAPEGIATLTRAEPQLQEPLLSSVRARELLFISGDFDDPNQINDAEKTALQILSAGQLDLRSGFLGPLANLLRTPKYPQGMADWAWQTAANINDPVVAQSVRIAALKEYLSVGKTDLARANVEKFQQNANDDPSRKAARELSDYLDAQIWSLSGIVPGSILNTGSNWKVTAIFPQQESAQGDILVSTAAPVDRDGHFTLNLAGAPLSALIVSGDGADGLAVIRELIHDTDLKPAKSMRYSQDFPPQPDLAPAAPPQASNGDTIIPMIENFDGIWPEQLIQVRIPHTGGVDPSALHVTDDNGKPVCCQFLGQSDSGVQIGFWRGLKPGETAYIHVRFDAALPLAAPLGHVTIKPDAEGAQIIDTGVAQFRIPEGNSTNPVPTSVAFIQGVKGPDGKWRGKAEWDGTASITQFSIKPSLMGPIRTSFICNYVFSNGATRIVTLSFDAAQPYMLIDEQATGDSPGDFIFHLDPSEGFDTYVGLKRPGRWTEPLVVRKPTLGMNLKDYPYFTSSGNGMLGGFMSSANRAKDLVSMFVVHPGDWFDPSYTEAFTSLNDNPDAPWDHPGRYTGSTHSAIQLLVKQNHDAPVHIPLSPGMRRWGIAVTDAASIQDSSAAWNIEMMLHGFNNGDLSRYLQMSFNWNESNDSPLRQEIAISLRRLRASPPTGLLAKCADQCAFDWLHQTMTPRMVLGIVNDDPVLVWSGWKEVLRYMDVFTKGCADLQTDPATSFDPVGGRGVSEYYLDYLLADQVGMLDDAARAKFQRVAALIAYHQLTADYMNYKENDGQPNFEVDRLLQLAAFAAAFPHHPMAAAIREHVLKQTAEMLCQWTILDGGKWAENIGTYYLHSLDCVCRLVYFLHFTGPVDTIVNSPAFDPFCHFAVNMLMPPQPVDSTWLKSSSFAPPSDYLRREPGIGSHGGEGGNFLGCPLALLAQVIRQQSPTTAQELLSAWFASGADMNHQASGGDGFGEYAGEFLLFGQNKYDGVPPVADLLHPKRLPGWGMIMRDKVGSDDEFYLAFHAGTVAYRDANYGSGIVLHALGRPLSLDGGDTFLPMDRSTLGFEVKPGVQGFCPLGKVTRWLVSGAVQFARGEFQAPNNPERFSRDVLMATGAQYVVIHDEQSTRWHGVFNFVTPALSAEQRPQGIYCKGKLGVNLWIIPLVDNPPSATFTVCNYGNERVTAPHQWHQIAVRIPFDKTSTIVLLPTKDSAPPRIRKLTDGVWQISGPGYADTLFTTTARSSAPGTGVIDFHGTLGLLRTSSNDWNFSLCNGSSVTINGTHYDDVPTTIFSDGHRVVLDDQAADR